MLSLLAHAAVQFAALLFLPNRTEPPSAPPETTIALVFAPAPADAPSAAEQPSPATTTEAAPTAPAPESRDRTPPAEPPPPPVAQELETPAPTPPPLPPPRAEEATPVPPEPPPPQPKPPPRQRTVVHGRSTPAPPPSGAPRSATPEELPTAAVGSAGPSVTAALVPPRPVAGMETNRAPIYPENARRRSEQGRVMLRVSVSADGLPLDVEVMGSSGYSSLDAAALAAVRRWRFIPATQAGKTLAAVAEVPIRFHLEN